jgi:hypothetical protein
VEAGVAVEPGARERVATTSQTMVSQ